MKTRNTIAMLALTAAVSISAVGLASNQVNAEPLAVTDTAAVTIEGKTTRTDARTEDTVSAGKDDESDTQETLKEESSESVESLDSDTTESETEAAGTEPEEITYTITELDETRYAVCSLNVRSGPSTDYDVIGTYAKNQEMAVTGQCDETGWYQVDYNGTVGYSSAKYTTDQEPEAAYAVSAGTDGKAIVTTGFTNTAGSGSYVGRLYIESLGVSVTMYNSNAQSVCDAQDSACWFAYGCQTLVADHVNQGFAAIKSAVPGETILYIESGGTLYRYICTGIDSRANNYGSSMATSDGTDMQKMNAGGITLYTCNSEVSHTSITAVYFQPY